jgi:O-antigen/teichoic acid export membrane protein
MTATLTQPSATAIAVSPAPADESVFKPALLLMSGRTVAFAATFFIPLVLARVFDPAQFGTYKQLFLIWSTVYSIAQLGMASSLYYFLPRAPRMAGGYVANCLLFLAATGLACLGLIVIAAPKLSHWLSNQELSQYLPWIGLYIGLTMFSTALEIVLISRGRYLWASASYAVSDLVRAAAFIVPALLFRQLDWVLKAAVLLGFLRVAVMLVYFRKEFRGSFKPDRALLGNQLAYAFPFGLAVLVEIVQASLPQYVVSHLFDPATFAIFAVGCLQIPLVDFAASPTSDVMMVKMQERRSEGRMQAVLKIWHDTTWKLALLFFPLAVFLMVDAREFITLLFTRRYISSAPIFMVWCAMILLTTLQVDGVMRVFAQTRFLLVLNLMRLAVIAGLIHWSLGQFHLIGAALVTVLATLLFKAGGLIRMKRLLEVGAVDLLPWRSLGALLAAAMCGVVSSLAIKSLIHVSPLPTILATGVAYTITYVGLVWRFNLLNESERLAIAGWVRRTRVATGLSLDCERV